MLKKWDGEKYVDVEELSIFEKGIWVKCNKIEAIEQTKDAAGRHCTIFNATGIEDGVVREFAIYDSDQNFEI